ncbi:hypothetical protein [Pseudomonas sp. K2I15]|uniref:hypothetical protein n=1 Tax=unclassified Pseudomonas TaxID=196821 RepID=UPI0011308B83|nr:hypothetical protein [Pseudomonas sp. K2I15]
MARANADLTTASYGMEQPLDGIYYQIYFSSADEESGKLEGLFRDAGRPADAGTALKSAYFKFQPAPSKGITLTFSAGDVQFELSSTETPYNTLSGTLFRAGKNLGAFTFSKVRPR